MEASSTRIYADRDRYIRTPRTTVAKELQSFLKKISKVKTENLTGKAAASEGEDETCGSEIHAREMFHLKC